MRCTNCYRSLRYRGLDNIAAAGCVHEHSGYEWCCVTPPAAITARHRAGADGEWAIPTCYAAPRERGTT